MAYPYSTLPTPITDSTTATPTAHAGHHNSVHAALNDLLTELGTDPGGASTVTSRLTTLEAAGSGLTGLHSGLLAVKVWDTGSSAYVWSGGTAPDSNGYTNIVFVDPLGTHNPASSTGGRSVTNDLWETGTTPAGVPSGGTSGQVLTKNSSTAYDASWATPSAGSSLGSIIAVTHYRPNTYTSTTISSSTFADVDATNLTVTFTAPSTGNVLIELSAGAYAPLDCKLQWQLRESSSAVTGTTMSVGQMNSPNGPTSSYIRTTTKHYVSGLTPSSSHTYKWGHARLSGASAVGTVYGMNGGDATEGGAALMTVWSVP